MCVPGHRHVQATRAHKLMQINILMQILALLIKYVKMDQWMHSARHGAAQSAWTDMELSLD